MGKGSKGSGESTFRPDLVPDSHHYEVVQKEARENREWRERAYGERNPDRDRGDKKK